MSISLVVRADPDATAPDATANVVPALLLDVPVEVVGHVPGQRQADRGGRGHRRGRRSRSVNTPHDEHDRRGASRLDRGRHRVRDDGRRSACPRRRSFLRPRSVHRPGRVGVEAVKAGPGRQRRAERDHGRPARRDPTLPEVTNLAATSGGTHEEFPRIGQKDVDEAVARADREARGCVRRRARGRRGSAARTPRSSRRRRSLGEATPTVDPATLVGKEQESFELALTATGTVTAVDATPVDEHRRDAAPGECRRRPPPRRGLDRDRPRRSDASRTARSRSRSRPRQRASGSSIGRAARPRQGPDRWTRRGRSSPSSATRS